MFGRPERIRVSLDCGDELVTKQSHKAECDIHNILRQYQRTGIMTHVQSMQGRFEDLPDVVDFQQALQTVMDGQAVFDALPAKVRDHFGNDPGRFLAAFRDPAERARLEEFGFLNPRPSSEGDSRPKEGPGAAPAG